MWAFGMSIYVYLTNNLPFDINGNLSEEILKCDYPEQISKLDCTDDLKDLMNQMLSKDPLTRPTFAQVLAHKWFQDRVPEVLSSIDDTFGEDVAAKEEP